MGTRTRFYVDIMTASSEVTGSCNLFTVTFPDKRREKFLVDCGLFQEADYDEWNCTLPFKPEGVKFVLVTHNHIDHIGRIPMLINQGFCNDIYATEDTTRLMEYALYDAYKVLKSVAKQNNTKCIYKEDDVDNVFGLLKPCQYGKTVEIDQNFKVTFFKNGHLIGASIILVQISYPGYEDINILLTGDYNNKNMFFDVEDIPEWVKELNLTIVQESTYGYMNSTEVNPVYENNVIKAIENNCDVVTLVFSLGRAQEILYVLKNMQQLGKISKDIPIYLDGKLAINYTNLYLKGNLGIKESMKDFLPENLQFVDKESRENILADANPKIIVTTSGMGSYGPAQTYIPWYLPRKKALIHFTGYAAENTLGGKLKKVVKGEPALVHGCMITKNADVEYTLEYSAHAKADEMIDFLRQFKHLKMVLINHGQSEVKEDFARRIVKEINPKQVCVLNREYYFRVDAYGFVKSFNSRFC